MKSDGDGYGKKIGGRKNGDWGGVDKMNKTYLLFTK